MNDIRPRLIVSFQTKTLNEVVFRAQKFSPSITRHNRNRVIVVQNVSTISLREKRKSVDGNSIFLPRRKASEVEQQGELKRKRPLKSSTINTAISTFYETIPPFPSPS